MPSRAALLLPATVLPGQAFRAAQGHVPAYAEASYLAASSAVATSGCQLPVNLLAAIGAVVSDHGRHERRTLLDGRAGYLMSDTDRGTYDGSKAVDGPVGPMGLLPWTFAHVKASAGADPTALPDAALAAARFLCADGTDLRTPTAQRTALLAYDAEPAFAEAVLTTEATLSR